MIHKTVNSGKKRTIQASNNIQCNYNEVSINFLASLEISKNSRSSFKKVSGQLVIYFVNFGNYKS